MQGQSHREGTQGSEKEENWELEIEVEPRQQRSLPPVFY